MKLTVPESGESISEVFVGRWLKSEGEAVKKDEPVVEVETDKASLELPSPVDGVLVRRLRAEGEAVKIGDELAEIEAGTAETKAPEPVAVAATPAPAQPASPEPAPAAVAPQPVPAVTQPARRPSPSARRAGVTEAVAPATAPAQVAPREEVVPMTPVRRRTAERLVESQRNAALLTTFNEADLSVVMSLRSEYREVFEKKHGIRLGFMSFFVKAAIAALQEIPELNAEIRGDAIVYKHYYDIGVAVSSPRGLLVPVLRDADQMSLAQIEQTLADLAERARTSKIKPGELQGGTFTISNGGVFGSLMSTPIVNPPQTGVLGMHAIQERPVVRAGEIVIRPMMYIALSYDHRIIDGREAVTFLKRVKENVENPTRLLLEV